MNLNVPQTELSLPNFLIQHLEYYWNDPVIFAPTPVTGRELAESAAGYMEYFSQLGIGKDSRVGMYFRNSFPQIAALLALWHLEAIPVFFHRFWKEERVHELLQSFPIHTLLSDTPFRDISQFHILPPPIMKKSGLPEMQIKGLHPRQPAAIFFTSGSTGLPKAVVHCWQQLHFSARGVCEYFQTRSGDGWILSLPLFHVGGLGILIRAFYSGMILLMLPDDVTRAGIHSVRGNRYLSLVETQFYRMLNHPSDLAFLKSLHAILLGGSAISDTLITAALREKLPVYTSYGSTEMASTVTIADPQLLSENPFSSGIPLPYREIGVQNGEIVVKGPTLFEGYWDGESIRKPVDDNGWFYTGDMGEIQSGNILVVHGRKDSMFISAGENIHPEFIEKMLLRIPEITEAIVVPIPDREYGSRPVAFVRSVVEPGVEVKTRWRSLLRQWISGLMVPVDFLPFPSHESGWKTSRKELTQLARQFFS